MNRIFDIALNDLIQIARDGKVFLFLLIMPIVFTLLFGYAFGGFSREPKDPRLPVAVFDQDDSQLSHELLALLANSRLVRLATDPKQTLSDRQEALAEGKLAGIVVVPEGYGQALLNERLMPLDVWTDPASTSGLSVQSEVQTVAKRLASTVWIAQIAARMTGSAASFDTLFAEALQAWQKPPIRVETVARQVQPAEPSQQMKSLAHTSPGAMLQFAIAGLLTAAQVIVSERKSHCLQRLLTTAAHRTQILLGHFLAILAMISTQFALLILFGQLILRVDYLRVPAATLLVALGSAVCIAALGLLIGVLARSEEQAIVFSILPMFVLSALGGAWVPLEYTGKVFQTIGHISPVAWAMDGFENIAVRGLGIESAWLPALVLVGYAALFFGLAAWRFNRE